jgi:hypothetical protein
MADTSNREYHNGMADPTFRQYIRKRDIRAADDFAIAAKADRKLPDVKTWGQLELYLVTKGATRATIDAAKKVWKGYREVKSRSRKKARQTPTP